MINIGQYIETLINWMMIHFSTFFDALNLGIGSFINGFQHILFGIPFYLTIAAMVLLAWAKAGRVPELSLHPFAGYFITELIGFPSMKAFILSSMICMRRSRAAALAQAMCGVM